MKVKKWTPEEQAIYDRLIACSGLDEIAEIIRADWSDVYFGAVPYLRAMRWIPNLDRRAPYGADDATYIVSYFLVNAARWRGTTARVVKHALKEAYGLRA